MYKKVLVTLDGSALARAALGQAATLAAGTGAEVVVTEVIEPLETLRREVGRMSFARTVSPRVSAERGQIARKVLTSGAEEALAARDCEDLPVTPTGIEPVT